MHGSPTILIDGVDPFAVFGHAAIVGMSLPPARNQTEAVHREDHRREHRRCLSIRYVSAVPALWGTPID